MDEDQKEFVRKEIRSDLAEGLISRIEPESAQVVSPIFVVQHPVSGKMRKVDNLKFVNSRIACQSMRQEAFNEIRRVVRKNDYMTTLDISQAFRHIKLHPEARKFTAFQFEGVTYQHNVLPFGLKVSPFWWNKTARVMIKEIRLRGIRAIIYVDDILLMSNSKRQAKRNHQVAIDIANQCGFLVNNKGVSTPTRSLTYIGMCLDTRQMKFRVPEEKLDRIVSLSERYYDRSHWTPRMAAQLAGLIQSVRPACARVNPYTRGMYVNITKGAWSWDQPPPTSVVKRMIPRVNWNKPIRITRWAKSELAVWKKFSKRKAQRLMTDPPSAVLIDTDASMIGWGATINLPAVGKKTTARGFWTPQQREKHITELEATAVHFALHSLWQWVTHEGLRQMVRGRTIQFRTDSIATMAVVNKGASSSFAMHQVGLKIHNYAWLHGWNLRATHIKGELNVIPDRLSRIGKEAEDYQFNKKLFEQINEMYGPFTVDRFATQNNALVRRYNALHWDPEAHAVDAFAQNWRSDNNWANPPFSQLHRVVQLVKEQRPKLVLIAPVWPAQPWFSELVTVAADVVVFSKDTPLYYGGAQARALPCPGWRSAAWIIPPRKPSYSETNRVVEVLRQKGVDINPCQT